MKTKTKATDFSEGSVIKSTLSLAVPLMVAQLINLLYNMVDRMYIGRIPGEGKEALTGLGLCFPIITMVTAFSHLCSYGGGPLFSMERGKGNDDEAGMVMGNSFAMLLIFGAVLTVLGLLFYRPILFAFGASEVTFPYARDYIVIYLCGTIFVMISLGMNVFINAQGFGTTGMLTVALGAGVNIALDPVFIFVLGLGAKGAALATIISQFLSAAWVLWFLTGKRALIPLKKKLLKLERRRCLKIFSLGLTGFTASFTNSVVQIACNRNLSIYGGDLYVGVMTILNSVREIGVMPVQGVTQGAMPVMSYNYGARKYDRVRSCIHFITVNCIVYTLLLWGALEKYPEAFIRLFNNDPVLIAAGVPSMHLYFWGFCVMSLQMAGQNIFVALGKAKQALFFSLFRKVGIVLPLTYILPRIGGLGVNGVFLAECISNLVSGLVCYTTMLLTVYRELLGKEPRKKRAKARGGPDGSE